MKIFLHLVLACIVLNVTASWTGGWWDNDNHAATETGDGGSNFVQDTLDVLYTGALNLATAPADDTVDTNLMNVRQQLLYRITGFHDVTISFISSGSGETFQQDITINSGYTIGYLREQLFVFHIDNLQPWLPGYSHFYNLLYGNALLQPTDVIEDVVHELTTATFSVTQVPANGFTENEQITIHLVDAYHADSLEAHYGEIQPFLTSPTYSAIVEQGGALHNTVVDHDATWRNALTAHGYETLLRALLRQQGFTNTQSRRRQYISIMFRIPGYTSYLEPYSVLGGLATQVNGQWTITLEVAVPQLNIVTYRDISVYQQLARALQDVHSAASSSAAAICTLAEATVNMYHNLNRNDEIRRRVLHQDEHDVEVMKELEAKVVETLVTQEPLPGEEEKRRELQTIIDVCHDGVYCSLYYQPYIPEYCWYFTSGEGHENSYCTMFGDDYCCHQSCGECSDSDGDSTVEIPNAEHYCQSGDRQTSRALCEDSSCCHWNTWESGDASFNGEGRCWSSYGDLPVDQCTQHSNHVEWHDQDAKGLVAADTGYQCEYNWYWGTITCGYTPTLSYWSRLTLIHVGGLDQTNLYTIRCPDNSYAGVFWYGFVYCGFVDTYNADGSGLDATKVFSIERVGHKEYAIRSVGTGDYCIDSYYGIICASGYDANHARARYHMFDWWEAVLEVMDTQDQAGRRELKEEQELFTMPDESRRNLFGLAKRCTVIDRSYEWCIGEHNDIKFADGTHIKYGGFKQQCYHLNQPFQWSCGNEKRSDVVITGTGHNAGLEGQDPDAADTMFVFYGNKDCSWTDWYSLSGSSKCKGRVTFTALECDAPDPSITSETRRQMQEGEPHFSMTEEEREAFLDNSRGFTREDDGFLVLEEEFHYLHENWEGEIPLKMQ